MFYVGFRRGDTWGIVDTSDNVTEFCDIDYIKRCIDAGVKIFGVDDDLNISIYDYEAQIRSSLAKNLMLSGFRLYVRPDGCLYSIDFGDTVPIDSKIVLGDYCSSIECGFLRKLRLLAQTDYYDEVDLYIDDRIKDIEFGALDEIIYANVALDIRELNNKELINQIYDEILHAVRPNIYWLEDHIHDYEIRFYLRRDEFVLFRINELEIRIEDNFLDFTKEFIIQRNSEQLVGILSQPVHFNEDLAEFISGDVEPNYLDVVYCLVMCGITEDDAYSLFRYARYIGDSDPAFMRVFSSFMNMAVAHLKERHNIELTWRNLFETKS